MTVVLYILLGLAVLVTAFAAADSLTITLGLGSRIYGPEKTQQILSRNNLVMIIGGCTSLVLLTIILGTGRAQ